MSPERFAIKHPASTLFGIMFPGWSFPSFWILNTHGFYFPPLWPFSRWQASRKPHCRPATAFSFPGEEAPESHVLLPCSASTGQSLHRRHSYGNSHQTPAQRLAPTSPPTLRPSWAASHLLSSLSPEMSEASETSTASKSCSFQQESSPDANQTRSSTPQHRE